MAKVKKISMAKNQSQAILSMQNDSSHIIARNDMRHIRFGIRQKSGVVKDAKTTTHISKVFWESISLLTPDDIQDPTKVISKSINIGDLVEKIGTEGHHKYVIEAARTLRGMEVMLVDNEGDTIYTGCLSNVKHVKGTGVLEIEISNSWAKYVLDIMQQNNFSFQKDYILILQNVSAVRLYPFFKSWLNKGVYDTSVERFKKDFGYDTSGYSLFSKLKAKVLDPAMREINEKTDILVRYEVIGENLDGIRPRISGLRFFIKAKEEKTEPKQLEAPKAVERPQKPTDEPQHISQVIQAKTPQSPQKPNTSEIEPSFQDIRNLVNDSILRDAEIEELIKDFGYIQAWERVKGFKIANVNQQIKVPFAYIIKAQSLGVGLWDQQKVQKAKKQAEAENQQIKQINEDYGNRKSKYFEEVHNQATEAEQAQVMQRILEADPNVAKLYIKDNQFTTLGKRKAGQLLLEELYSDQDIKIKGLLTKKTRQHNFRNTIFGKEGIQVDFDENDNVVKRTLFDTSEVITSEQTEPIKQTKPRTKKPQAQKPIETKRSKADEKQEVEQEPQPTPKKKLWERILGR